MMQQCCSSTYLAVLCMLLCHKWSLLGYHVYAIRGALGFSVCSVVALGIMRLVNESTQLSGSYNWLSIPYASGRF